MAVKEGIIEVEGIVVKLLRDATFIVKLSDGNEIIAHASGKIRKSKIRILMHDKVLMEVSSYGIDKSGVGKGRITRRLKVID
ncbi:translation initiation factor IF-1 [Neoehrlichia mikurensis]|uniref:Translation initiation factor IF-1 n=1 Tax=Neoehrlichia mikurensis TaxID=89586 RepID=A0A9Q9BS92_9RICK|nr:translation initiation factor IF-1 [Neoehrlichia mikurensis]QXK91874.1 translation initiation factor IF-1 [Neoehrlichia mikurensis]QXK93087.1 translation initiation factor IF-1 [Neoehrlichia mikurensis]QXK93567.1 translation initiation factor IF-1 [Neoehrlichia mikurensis]UTO55480.1 translation initiation factor IF-1 [Neoehrlichia mikurensis]UTO56400.1 translation initiation factor IF-1 [Neoehrlichia mikurensis]